MFAGELSLPGPPEPARLGVASVPATRRLAARGQSRYVGAGAMGRTPHGAPGEGKSMRSLTFEDFAGRLGKAYEIVVGGGRLPLVLEEAQQLPGSARQGGGFRLVFRGPYQPIVPQGVYPLQRGSETYEIFVVPIGQTPKGVQYEAIFM